MTDFFEQVAALRRTGQPFAVATVVARRPPVSAHLGDRAIVHADGRMEGFVGGACSREIVKKQALEALRTSRAVLVSIRPDASEMTSNDPEHVVVPMTCVSEGAIDVYVEPFLPPRRLVVVGATPVAEALARTAVTVSYDVVRIVDANERHDLAAQPAGITIAPLESLDAMIGHGDVAVVVASQGHYDEEALETALKHGVSYVGLVASRKRGATVRGYLESRGAAGVASVRIPAGLDLGARTAPEVALSILAEIVQARPSQGAARETAEHRTPAAAKRPAVETTSPAVAGPATAVDPVCGMTVDVATARHSAEAEGVIYYFCGAGCKARFIQNPRPFLSAHA